MVARGQIVDDVLGVPLVFDNAISLEAAQMKGIIFPVAGQLDILRVYDLESGNILAKQLTYLTSAASAGIIMGAQVPSVLISRADTADGRLASIAVMCILAHAR